MIKKIGVENFRVFKDYTEFEIRPITLLTGPNNSGKSSLTKLLMLLQNGFGKIDFTKGQHNLEKFEDILSWETNKEELFIKLPLQDFMFQGFNIVYTYIKSKLSEIRIENDEKILLDFKFELPSSQENRLGFSTKENVHVMSFDLKYYLDLFYEHKILILNNDKTLLELKNLKVENKDFYIKDFFDGLEEEDEFFEPGEDIGLFFQDTINNSNEALKNELERLEKDYLLFDIYIEDKNITIENTQLLLDLQSEILNNMEFYDSIRYGPIGKFRKILTETHKDLKKEIQFRLQKKLNSDQVMVKDNILSQIVFNRFEEDFNFPLNIMFDLTNLFSPDTKFYSHSLFTNEIEYISPNRGSQKRILHNSSENDIDQIIVDYSQLREQKTEFLEEVFKVLGIKGKLIIERHEDYISKVYLQKGNKKISLSDLGYGYSQIIPIVLKICIISNSRKAEEGKILIIEEPEANLHPALQSKFADILLLALKEFPTLHFIIETHSEYFIRKLQFLTAKKEIATNDSIIYYFNADDNVSHEEPKVKMIEITETGNLTDSFGPGFYDETTRLQFELMKAKKEQKN